jgi:hypothetical protein
MGLVATQVMCACGAGWCTGIKTVFVEEQSSLVPVPLTGEEVTRPIAVRDTPCRCYYESEPGRHDFCNKKEQRK